jgi:hypothetical protein
MTTVTVDIVMEIFATTTSPLILLKFYYKKNTKFLQFAYF